MEESGVWNGVLVLSSCTCGVILVSELIRRGIIFVIFSKAHVDHPVLFFPLYSCATLKLFTDLMSISDGWNKTEYPFKKLEHGKWELVIPPNADGGSPIPHDSVLKVYIPVMHPVFHPEQPMNNQNFCLICLPGSFQLVVVDKSGSHLERLSPWATYVVQPEKKPCYDWRFWDPPAEKVFHVFEKEICVV